MEKECIVIEKPIERSGVYVILNIIKKMVYIGESIDFYKRMSSHIRGIYGNGNGTNENLKNEEIKAFEMFPVLFSEYKKSSFSIAEQTDWIIDETIYMYIFRKNGYKLYNGNNNLKDNTGEKREFLLDDTKNIECVYNDLIKFLGVYNGPKMFRTWEDYIETAENVINEDIERRFGKDKNLLSISRMSDEDRKNMWDKRLQELKEGKYFIVDKSNYKNVCGTILNERLSKMDLLKCGLKKKTVQDVVDLINKGNFDRILVSKFGHYLNQGPMTILSTKVHDINSVEMDKMKGLPIEEQRKNQKGCFWALKKLPIDTTREFLSDDDKEPKYIIMPYTKSRAFSKQLWCDDKSNEQLENILNPSDGENIDKFCNKIKKFMKENNDIAEECLAYGYAIDFKNVKNKKGNKYKFPIEMTPAVVSKYSKNWRKSANAAVLISEIAFIDATYIDTDRIYECFNWVLGNGKEKELKKGIRSITSHFCAELKSGEKDTLIKCLTDSTNVIIESRETSFLIARLEYPYILALVNDNF